MSTEPTTDGRVQTLPAHVANQIAAGEVVERPSSVVKELIENSLDAGATKLTLRLKEGGRQLIRVIDDGHGMGPLDAQAAFAPHATSKLMDADQLQRIVSYGFRGEALASISSVARVRLVTRRAEDEFAVVLSGGGGQPWSQTASPSAVGTDLSVEELFFNVPARQKFLRTSSTELGHIMRLLDALALARPALTLELWHNDRRVTNYPAVEDLQGRCAQVFEADEARRLHAVAGEGAYAVEGALSEPSLTKGSPSGLVLLVNGRWVQDKTLQHAIVQGYGAHLAQRRYPVGVLKLTCPPGTVDVNVHPSKTEVRFVSTVAVHRAVSLAVSAMVQAEPWSQLPGLAEPAQAYQSRPAPSKRREPTPFAPSSSVSPRVVRDPWRPEPLQPRSSHRGLAGVQPTTGAAARPANHKPQTLAPTSETGGSTDAAHWVGQLLGGEWLVQRGDTLALARPEAFWRRYLQRTLTAESVAGRRLLVPKTIAVGPQAASRWMTHQEPLESLGFEVVAAGERALLFRMVPAVVSVADLEGVIRGLSERLLSAGEAVSLDRATLAQWYAAAIAEVESPPSQLPPRWIHDLSWDCAAADILCLPLGQLRAVLAGEVELTWTPR